MGRRIEEAESQDWLDEEEEEGEATMGEVYEDADDGLEPEAPVRTLRPVGPQRLMARRLIEQAREKRELSKCLADFDDYVV